MIKRKKPKIVIISTGQQSGYDFSRKGLVYYSYKKGEIIATFSPGIAGINRAREYAKRWYDRPRIYDQSSGKEYFVK